jgi:hypothetical protein
MVARHGIAERLTDLSGAPEAHIAALTAALRMGNNGGSGGASAAPVWGGAFSLQNAVDQAVASLKGIPPYGTRELLLLQSALATCDPVRREASACARAWQRCALTRAVAPAPGQHPRVHRRCQGGAPARLRRGPRRRGTPPARRMQSACIYFSPLLLACCRCTWRGG